MTDLLSGFLDEFFVRPIIDPSVPGYNPVNTLTYGAILLGLAFYVIYPALNRRGIRFDWKMLRALLPYIFFGSALRVLEDRHLLVRSVNPLDIGFYIYTPGIWFLTFALVVLGIILGRILAPHFKKEWQTLTMGIGIIFALPVVVLNVLSGVEWVGSLGILALAGAISMGVFFIVQKKKWTFLDSPLAKVAFFGQLLDTSATFVALQFFGCGEQHVLPRLLFGAVGNVSFFFVKIPIIMLILYYLHKEIAQGKEADENMYGFILVFLSILGLATGTRDLVTVLVGTCTI